MDTLTFLIQILGAIVECAKLVVGIVAVVLIGIFLRYIALKWRKILSQAAGAVFVLSVVSANFEQSINFISICWARLGTTVAVFTVSVTSLLVLFAVILVTAIANGNLETRFTHCFGHKVSISKILKKDGKISPSNSFLAITPVLVS